MLSLALSPDGRRLLMGHGKHQTVIVEAPGLPIPGPRVPGSGPVRKDPPQDEPDLWLWDLAPAEGRPVEILTSLANVLAGRRLDVTGQAGGGGFQEPSRRLGDIPVPHAPAKGFSSEEARIAWHHDKGQETTRAGLPEVAVLHLTRVIEVRPKEGPLYGYRGHARAALGKWQEAGADYSRAGVEGGRSPS